MGCNGLQIDITAFKDYQVYPTLQDQEQYQTLFAQMWNDGTTIGNITALETQFPEYDIYYYYITLVSSFIAFAILTHHIWNNRSAQYAMPHDLFLHPTFEAYNLGVNHLLNRRIRDRLVDDGHDDYHLHTPYIFICTTLWHEERVEMETLLRTLVRLIIHQKKKREVDKNCYELEINIFFDNTFDSKNSHDHEDDKKTGDIDDDIQEWKTVNMWVKWFCDILHEVLKNYGMESSWEYAQVFPTPYGGRIVYNIAGTPFNIHLKDAQEVKKGKRWSQIMYLYYLFGWKIDACNMTNSRNIKLKKENSYLLALDGDVDFEPIDFELVLARMQKNPDVAACCNQIHPSGSGPLVWFQRFEYAVGHWFQKASEHILGCVLCSPGCFSLVRVSNLMKDNVMAMYKSLAYDARTKLMMDQGEDRWLCTLMLLTGGRIEFEAGSHCQTFAPEDLDTFYKQRRRWGPSTAVNIFELISKRELAVSQNSYITNVYIFYQLLILVLSTVGVSCTMMVIWEALELGLGDTIGQDGSAALIFLPIVGYIIVCFKGSQKAQLLWAKIFTVFYAIVMVLLTVSIFVAAGECPMNLTAFFLMFLAGIHVVAAVLHWDWPTLFCGIIYWVAIPSNFMFLQIYMLTNINDVSWGTRSGGGGEKKKKLTIKERIESYYKGKPYPGIGTVLSYIWRGEKKIEGEQKDTGIQCIGPGASDGDQELPTEDNFDQPVVDPTSDSDTDEEEMDRQFRFTAYEQYGMCTDAERTRPGLKDLPTDEQKHSPFAVFGGATIEHLRKETKIKMNRQSRKRISAMKENQAGQAR